MVIQSSHLPLGVVESAGTLQGVLSTYGSAFALLGGGKSKRKQKQKKSKSKKRKVRRTRRSKGRRTKYCKCKICRCKTCKCTKKRSRMTKRR